MAKRAAKPPLTVEALKSELEQRGIECKFNVISNSIEFHGFSDPRISREHVSSVLPTQLYSDLLPIYSGVQIAVIRAFLLLIAVSNPINPITEFIDAEPWDGVDRLQKFYSILHIDSDDQLSRVLLLKWLWQGLSLLHNNSCNPFGADGVLVLNGLQGVGKTSLSRWLAINPAWFREGVKLSKFDKDFQRRALTCWICELGEVDRSFDSAGTGELKAFITQSYDEYRRPYGHNDEATPRRTSLICTVNDTRFLQDQDGNRRFWTIPIRKIDLESLAHLDAVQLWRQVWKQYARHDLQGFRLSTRERQKLEERNSSYLETLPGEDEILDILARDDTLLQQISVSQWLSLYPELRRYTTKTIVKVLDKLGYKMEYGRREIDGKNGRWRILPVPNSSPIL